MSELAGASAGMPLVSIGMSVRNSESTLEPALNSILQQSYPHWELLLLDDGSSDGTPRLARRYKDPRIRLIVDGKRLGLAARLNQAVSLAKGTYFARMDGDDVCYPARLERQVAMLESRQDVDLLGCGSIVFNSDGRAVGMLPVRLEHEEICKHPWAGFYLAHPTWMGKMEWFRKYPYRQDAIRAQDQDLLLRTYRQSRFAALPEILLGYRQETLSIARMLRGRYYFSRALLRQLIAGGDWRLARGLAEQPVKGLIDLLAVGTGLNYRLLRHRAIQIEETAHKEWEAVWSATNRPVFTARPPLAINTQEG